MMLMFRYGLSVAAVAAITAGVAASAIHFAYSQMRDHGNF